MFDQALNVCFYMTIGFVLLLVCTLFLVWCNQSINAARLLRIIGECHQYNKGMSLVKKVTVM